MNKSAQFTPGPWRKGIDNTIYQSKTNKRIADVYMHMIYRDSDAQAQANATLIAAAPAMYEALRMLIALDPRCHRGVTHCGECGACLGQAALAQAEGKAL